MITWTCHICKEERPDHKISVYTKDMSMEYRQPLGTMKMNIRYCNDNPTCISKAPNHLYFKKETSHAKSK